jgi:Protein of unknown function (DUF1552)
MRITRRTMLRGAGGVAIGLPFLEQTMPRAYAQTGAPKRLVVFIHGQGTMLSRWKPTATGANFTLPQMLSPLESLKSKINVWSDIDNKVRDAMQSNGHNAAGRSLLNAQVFTNPGDESSAGAGPSVDQVIAQRLAKTQPMPMQSLETQVVGGVGEYQMIFSAPGVRVAGLNDPRAVWTRITRVVTPSTPPTPAQPTLADMLHGKRSSVLDAVKENFRQVKGNLGSADKLRLDAHMARIEEMEKGLAPLTAGGGGTPAASCTVKPHGLPAAGYSPSDGSKENIHADKQIDNVVMALACNVTPVASLQFTNYHGPTFDWLNIGLGGNWHDRVHNGGGDNVEGMARAFQWYGTMFAELCKRMDAIDEGTGSMLDNSLVLWLSEFGDGGAHNCTKLPVVVAGGLGGTLKTGRHVNFAGRTHNDLFVTLLNLFGGDDRAFGVAGLNKGALPIA